MTDAPDIVIKLKPLSREGEKKTILKIKDSNNIKKVVNNTGVIQRRCRREVF